MDPIIKKAYQSALKGQSYAFATIISSTLKGTPRKEGAKMVVMSDGSIVGTIGGGQYEKSAISECKKAIKRGKPTTVTYEYFGKKGQGICGGQIKIFIEPFAQNKHLVICGAGHIALPLSFIGKLLNFKVTILDNRKEYANKTRFSHVDKTSIGNYNKMLSKIPINQSTYIMIVTHGHEYDFDCLKAAIKSDAKYIGVISSGRKRKVFISRLKKMGVSNKDIKRINIPAGIDIGAQTPEEIALSISAEIIAEYNKEFVDADKFKQKPKV